jgi:poly-gamma-glutamate capsule biosynthesis protein CapA/YwtB (metallophosphatase superfamily)
MTEPVRLAFVGDIMCGDSFSLIGRGAAAMIDRWGGRFVDEAIVDSLRGHDLALGNIECVLSDAGRKENSLRRLHMRGRPQTCGLLADWGLTVANVANNHILEQGPEAAEDTVLNLKLAGLDVIGAGADGRFGRGLSFIRKKIKDTVFYLSGVCLRREQYAYDGGADVTNVVSAVEKLRAAQPDAVIVLSVHWGNEYIEYPSLEQRWIARQLARAGAKLIIGHHPHVVQGVDQINGTLVAYSLGNFIFDGFSRATGWSMILSVSVCDGKIDSVETLPIERKSDFRPALAVGLRYSEYLAEIARRNALCSEMPSDPTAWERDYRQKVRLLCQDSRKLLWRSLAGRFFRFRPVFWPQLLFRPLQRRLGAW